jgi:hypothetical protein
MHEIDWSQAPKTARWWAMDENSKAHWFGPPNFVPFTRFWLAEPVPAPTFGYTGPWKGSLVERPD